MSVSDSHESQIGSYSVRLVRFIDDFFEDKRSLPFQFYFVNSLTSFDLLKNLSCMGHGRTGTIEENGLDKNLSSTLGKGHQEEGKSDYRVYKQHKRQCSAGKLD